MTYQEQGRGTLNQVEIFSKLLGIEWDVRLHPSGDRPTIISDQRQQEHRLGIPLVYYLHQLDLPRCDIANLLVKASLAETIDPIFSTVYFHSRHDSSDLKFQAQKDMLYYAQQVTDLWTADGMDKMDKSLLVEDIQSWHDAVINMPIEELLVMPYVVMLGKALVSAQIERYGLHGFKKLEQRLDKKMRGCFSKTQLELMRSMSEFYAKLPILSPNRETSMALLEQNTQQAAEILGFDIKPTLVQDQGNWVWTFGEEIEN